MVVHWDYLNLNSFRKHDGELADNFAPVSDRQCPFSGDVILRQPKQFGQRIVVRKNAGRLGDFSELPIESLDDVGGIDDFSDLVWIGEESGKLAPISLPGFQMNGVLAPVFFHLFQRLEARIFCRRTIDIFQIGTEFFLILAADIFYRVPDLVDDATLDFRFRKDLADRLGKAGQTINACNEDVGYATESDFI